MTQRSILVIEDDDDIVELLRYTLQREHFRVLSARSGEAGLELVTTEKPSLILLDLGLPTIQGLDVCRNLKQNPATAGVPIVVLTARSEESDIVLGLELGADDYLTKPCKIRELVARIRAVLRRSELVPDEAAATSQAVAGPLFIDDVRFEARLNGRPLVLTLAEFRLLGSLVRNSGRVLTREQLLQIITDGTAPITERNVDVHIRSIRKKLGSERDLIQTVRGVGYRLREP